MNDADRKLLTEYIGECWHWPDVSLDGFCNKCKIDVLQQDGRTFDTWADLEVVKEAIERKGEWRKFLRYTWTIWGEEKDEYTSWLINPSRFCDLAGEWLEQKRGSNI